MSIDILVVAFEKEIPLLKLQAQSIHLYVLPQDVNSITVIWNDHGDPPIDTAWWGQHKHKVNIKKFDIKIQGWYSQQLCKLLAAAESTIEWTMVLDCKAILINLLDLNRLISPDNKIYSKSLDIDPTFAREKRFVENLFNVQNIKCFYPGGVVFYLHSSTVRSLIADVEQLTQTNFINFFQTHSYDVAEYILYSGYVYYKFANTNELYVPSDNLYIYSNISHYEVYRFEEKYQETEKFGLSTLSFALHRGAYQQLTDYQKEQWLDLLLRKKIICSVEETKKEINTLLTR